jgi:hypothetical protein
MQLDMPLKPERIWRTLKTGTEKLTLCSRQRSNIIAPLPSRKRSV